MIVLATILVWSILGLFLFEFNQGGILFEPKWKYAALTAICGPFAWLIVLSSSIE